MFQIFFLYNNISTLHLIRPITRLSFSYQAQNHEIYEDYALIKYTHDVVPRMQASLDC